MIFACKRNLGLFAIVLVLLLAVCCYFCSRHTEMLATGLIDEKLKEKLHERPYLTPEEYEEILKKIEDALRIDPSDLSANLLKAELEAIPIVD